MTFSDSVDTRVSGPGLVPVRTEEPTIGALVHDLSQQLAGIGGVKEDIATVKGARR